MKKTLVSVVIPAYNCSKYISEAVDSALAQDVSVEVIVIDDCSTDDLDIVMQKYTDVPNVIYLHNAENLGVAETRNKGVAAAKGEYIAFLDADDIWLQTKLSKQLSELGRTGYVLCTTARELINSDGISLKRIIPVKSVITYKTLLKHNSINCSSVLIKTDVAREFPMHSDDCHEDYIMWLEVLSKYEKACGINEPLLKYRVSDRGKSGNKLKSAKMTFMVYRKIGLSFPKAILCFISYMYNGVKKHFFGGMGD